MTNASIQLTIEPGSTATSGWFEIDVRNDLTSEANWSVEGSQASQRFESLRAGFNFYLLHNFVTGGNVDVPTVLRACPAGGTWAVTLSNISINYTDTRPPNSLPVFRGQIPNVEVHAGETNWSIRNLGQNFVDPDGDGLYLCAHMLNAPPESGASAFVRDTTLFVRASSTSWTGDLTLQVAAQEVLAEPCSGVLSDNVTVHVLPATLDLRLRREIPDVFVRPGDASAASIQLVDYFQFPSGVATSVSWAPERASDPLWAGISAEIRGEPFNDSDLSLQALAFWAPYDTVGDLRFKVKASTTNGQDVESNWVTLRIASWNPPVLTSAIPSFVVVRGERILSAINLRDHFALPNGVEISWNWNPLHAGWPWNSRLDMIGDWVDITAGDPNWTGVINQVFEACEGSWRCTPSNNFTVRFVDRPPATLAGELTIAADGFVGDSPYEGDVLNLTLAGATPVPPGANVTWFIEGTVVGYGDKVGNITFPVGSYRIEARISTAEGDRWAVRTLSVNSRAGVPHPQPNGPGLGPLTGEVPVILILFGVAVLVTFFGLSEGARYAVLGPLVGAVFARLKRDSLLDHFARGRLYQIIVDEPGIHFSELRRRTSMSNGSAIHHLTILEKAGFVRVVLDGALSRFYVTDQALDPESFGLTDTDRKVLDVVLDRPGITQPEIEESIDRSASVVSRTVARLSALGYVRTTSEGHARAVFPRTGSSPATEPAFE